MPSASIPTAPARSARLGLRATPEQEMILREAAQVRRKMLTEFILESACQAAQDTLSNERVLNYILTTYDKVWKSGDRRHRPHSTKRGSSTGCLVLCC